MWIVNCPQNHLLKRLSFTLLNCLGLFVKNQLTRNVKVYIWTLDFAPLIYKSILFCCLFLFKKLHIQFIYSKIHPLEWTFFWVLTHSIVHPPPWPRCTIAPSPPHKSLCPSTVNPTSSSPTSDLLSVLIVLSPPESHTHATLQHSALWVWLPLQRPFQHPEWSFQNRNLPAPPCLCLSPDRPWRSGLSARRPCQSGQTGWMALKPRLQNNHLRACQYHTFLGLGSRDWDSADGERPRDLFLI